MNVRFGSTSLVDVFYKHDGIQLSEKLCFTFLKTWTFEFAKRVVEKFASETKSIPRSEDAVSRRS